MVNIVSGFSSPATSGDVVVRSSNGGVLGASGTLLLSTGTTNAGTTGWVMLASGAATGGNSGALTVQAGDSTAKTGAMVIRTGASSGLFDTGDMLLSTGSSSGGNAGSLTIVTGA